MLLFGFILHFFFIPSPALHRDFIEALCRQKHGLPNGKVQVTEICCWCIGSSKGEKLNAQDKDIMKMRKHFASRYPVRRLVTLKTDATRATKVTIAPAAIPSLVRLQTLKATPASRIRDFDTFCKKQAPLVLSMKGPRRNDIDGHSQAGPRNEVDARVKDRSIGINNLIILGTHNGRYSCRHKGKDDIATIRSGILRATPVCNFHEQGECQSDNLHWRGPLVDLDILSRLDCTFADSQH